MAKIQMNTSGNNNIPTLPIGSYNSVISAIWDVGMQEKEWQGEKRMVHQLIVRIEVSKLIEAEGEYKGKRYNVLSWVTVPKSYNDKSNIVKLANAALGRVTKKEEFSNFDTDVLIGKCLTISVEHTSGGNAKVTGYSQKMDGMESLVPELDPKEPQWVTDMRNTPAPDDDLPF